MRQREDFVNTRRWALAFVGGGGFVISAQTYMLANCDTGRAHLLHFVGGGLTTPKPQASVNKKSLYKYTRFNTSKPANFNDFDGGWGRISELKIKAGISFSKTYLNLWARGDSAYFSTRLAKPELGGGFGLAFKFKLPEGQALVHGTLGVDFGNGEPNGKIPDARLQGPDDHGPSGPRAPHFSNKAYEDPIRLPADVLFGFDSAYLGASANESLELAASIIENRLSGGVTIEGHTDSKGKPGYNMNLSMRRATAVREWFVNYGLHNAKGFHLKGRGEEVPVAPNDNPEGRALNRRVEIQFKG